MTALTIANTDIKLWVAGATAEASKNSGGATHIAAGRYYAVLDATDTATLGSGEINVHVAGALPVRRAFVVLTALVYDSLVAGSDNLQVDAVQLAGQVITAASGVTFPSSVASPTNITAGTITTVTTVTNQLTAAQIAAGVWQDATAGDFTVASSIGKSLYTGNVAPGAAGGHFIAGTNAATTITTALTTTFTGNLTGSVGSVTGAVGSVTGAVGSVAAAVTLPTIPNNWIAAAGIADDAFTAAKFAADVTTELQSGLATAAALSTVAGYLDTEVAAILADTNELQSDWADGGRLDLLIDAIKAKTDILPASFPTNFASTVISAGGLVSINTAQTLSAARALDAIGDTSLTLNDAFHCAIAGAAGDEAVVSTAYTIMTPSTNTVLRTFALDSSSAPTSRT